MMRWFVLCLVAAVSACRGGQAQEPSAPPAAPVQVVTVTPTLIEDSTDYVATLVSRQAVSLFAQVSGYVRAIPRAAGAPVKRGDVLVEIDAAAEQAALRNLEATRQSQAAAAAFARDRLQRARTLSGEGIVSQQALDEARAGSDQAEAALLATDALIASQRARVGYFRVVAPIDGVLGNVPVKVGDFVTPATPLTSVTQQSALEAEVRIPAERVSRLTPASTVRLHGPGGEIVGEQPVSFVAPRAEQSTQLVLIKAVFPPHPAVRADQLVRATVVWRQVQGLTIPTAAVLRQAGQPFGYVVESKDELAVARRVPLTLGVVGSGEVEVLAGLDAGQRLVVSGIQMLADGAAVETQPAQPAGAP